jgi:hypothetical protein
MTVISIIGSAMRNGEDRFVTRPLYEAMYAITVRLIEEWSCETAASGGAAFADHIAVRAFNEGIVPSLRLYMPAPFQNGAFVPDRKVTGNPGETANGYHRLFSEACGFDSLSELDFAIRSGATVEYYKGFKRRNLEVAAIGHRMLAYTFGSGVASGVSAEGLSLDTWLGDEFVGSDAGFTDPSEAGLRDRGGTAHTWGESWKAESKRHVNLHVLRRLLDAKPLPEPVP